MFKVRTDEKNLYFNVEISNELKQYVQADESRIRQILINLLGNALKFTRQGGITWRIQTVSVNKESICAVIYRDMSVN